MISGVDLSIEVDEIKCHLADSGVTNARRLTTIRDGVKVETSSVVLSFSSPSIQSKTQQVKMQDKLSYAEAASKVTKTKTTMNEGIRKPIPIGLVQAPTISVRVQTETKDIEC